MVSREQIQSAVDRYFAANAALDADAVANLFAPGARMYRVPGEPPLEGREAIRQAYHQLLGAIARYDGPPAHTYILGNGAAVQYQGQITAKRGGTVAIEGINVYALDDAGLITEIRYYWDPTPVYAVLRG